MQEREQAIKGVCYSFFFKFKLKILNSSLIDDVLKNPHILADYKKASMLNLKQAEGL